MHPVNLFLKEIFKINVKIKKFVQKICTQNYDSIGQNYKERKTQTPCWQKKNPKNVFNNNAWAAS